MTISSLEAAHKICELSDWKITNLKLQKILYLCHLFYLGEKKEPLVDEEFEAWYYGPVVSSLYNKLKQFSDRPITNIFHDVDKNNSSKELSFIEETYNKMKTKSTWDLVLMTHLKGGAWEKYFDENCKNIKIPNSDIIEEYERFYDTRN